MQTFLPFPSFAQSARVLDNRRLGKQRVEVLQLLKAILDPNAKGWKNHPAAKEWRGYERCLIRYGVAICDEWISRGFKDTCRGKILAWSELCTEADDDPWWLGDETMHSTHRSSLLRKDPAFYGKHAWTDDPEEPYMWPAGRSGKGEWVRG